MKKFLITVVALITATVFQASAMSTARARQEALFLTDKMAYELNLTDYQYEAVYEINFDYFNSLVGTSDILGIYWTRRANELGYVLTSWQYHRFLESEYFYRPVTYRNNVWYFSIYDRYAYNRFYRPAPKVYITYNGNRNYHSKPHNNKHFADNHIGKGPAHNPGNKPADRPNNKPNTKPNTKPDVKPNNGHNGNVGKPANGGGNHNANVGGNTKPTKPAGGNNVGNTPTHSKPAGNVNGGGARRASVAAPTRSATSTPRTSSSAARASGSSAGRR